jgi:hypothetical protein
MADLEQRMGMLERRVDGIEDALNDMVRRMNRVEHNIGTLLADVKAGLAVARDVKQIVQVWKLGRAGYYLLHGLIDLAAAVLVILATLHFIH